MARGRRGRLHDLFLAAPWWLAIIAAGVVYTAAAFILPVMFAGHALTAGWAPPLRAAAPFVALVCLLPAPYALWCRSRLSSVPATDADERSLRSLSRLEFEKLVADVLARMGYGVVEAGECNLDRGVDLVASATSEKLFVQCRHPVPGSVGFGAVQELYSAMTGEGATGGALVTSGGFSNEALAYAAGKPIQLIDGETLECLAASLADRPAAATAAQPALVVRCPECGSPMVARTGKRGRDPNETFWGCSRYPVCRGTREAHAA